MLNSLLLVLAIGVGSGTIRAAEPTEKKVLLIGIDGCRADAIDYSQARHLKKLMKEGAFTDKTDVLGDRDTSADTSTGPGWSTALTGVFADKHGVKDNTFAKNTLRDYPTFLSRYRKAKPQASVAALITWKQFDDFLFTAKDGSRFLVDGDKKGYEEGDRQVAKAAEKLMAGGNPDILFAYFGNTDSLGHGYGFHPKSPKYTNGIETIDGYIGGILTEMKSRNSYAKEDWLVIVCTDHGGQGRGHSGGQKIPEVRTGFLILHGPSVEPGIINAKTTNADVAATALAHLGVPIKKEWKLDGKVVGLMK